MLRFCLVGSVAVALLCLLSADGFCVGEIEHPFAPAETYPGALKDMHLQTTIVEDATPDALIVVNTDDPIYRQFADDINTSIHALPGLSGTSLDILDDDAFVRQPRFDTSIILIGNYATNQAIRRYVYEKKLQHVDIGRPGPDSWVISNLRVGQEIGGHYRPANAIVIASESPAKLREAVELFRTTMLSAACDGKSIIFDESVPGKHNTHWSITPDYSPPVPIAPSVTASHSLGEAVSHANLYLLTGKREEADLFVSAMNSYGSIAEDPQWFGAHAEGHGFCDAVGDNSGALDFLMKDVVTAWMAIQRTPYFSDPGLPRNPSTGIDERLYIDKLINWMAREYYKCPTARGLIDAGPGKPQVRGAIGYAECDGFPLGNHELRAALGLYLIGQYFTRDGYAYDASNARDYFYDASYPDDHAAQWIRDGDIAFAPYLQLSWSNDDAAGYYDSDTGFTRDYLRLKDSPALSEAYYGSSGGSLGVGMDRCVADSFCLVTPNSLMKPGFGDTHDISLPEYEIYDLWFWREKYLDGRYGWMSDDLYRVRPLKPAKWGKSFLQYGLVNLGDLGIENREPADLLGIKVIPLQTNLYNAVNSFGGRASYGNDFYGDPYEEAHVAPGEATNKVVLRSGWGHGFDQGRDQYLGVDCVSYLGHGHEDALGIFGFEDNDAIFIIDDTYYSTERGYQNAVTVRRTDQPPAQQQAKSNSSTVARVAALGDFGRTGFIDLELPQYGNFIEWGLQPAPGEWSVNLHRSIFWQKEGLLLVLDQAKANDPGTYELSLRWKPNNTPAYSCALKGDTIDIVRTAEGKHCAVRTLGGSYSIDRTYGNALMTSTSTLTVGDTASIPTLVYTFGEGADPDYRILSMNGGSTFRIASSVTHEDIYLGRTEVVGRRSCGDFRVDSKLFWIEPRKDGPPGYFALTEGTHLSQETTAIRLFSSDRPAWVESRIIGSTPGGTITTGQGATKIDALYVPAGLQLIVDGQATSVPFTLTAGTHQFAYRPRQGGSGRSDSG